MNKKVRSRKKHLVEGTVSEVKKQEEALDTSRVGESRNAVTKLMKKIRKERRDAR